MNRNQTTITRVMAARQQADVILARRKAMLGGLDMRMEDVDNDEGPAPGEETDDDGDGDGSDDDPDDDGKDDADDDEDHDKDKDDDKVDRTEYERVKRHRAAADRKVAERDKTITDLRKEITDLQAGKGGDDGKKLSEATERADKAEATNQAKDETIQQLRIDNAFLTSNKHAWHDPADALRLADLSGVEIEEDGTVVGLKEALDALAKAKPHMVKKDDAGNGGGGSSGSRTNGKRKGGSTKPDRKALATQYPVLNRR